MSALVEIVDSHQLADPLAQISVIVPNAQVGYKVRERLVEQKGSAINIRTFSLDQFALFIAAPELARQGLRHYTKAKRREAAFQAARSTQTRMSAIANHPDTPAAILALLDLTESDEASLPAELAPIKEEFRRLLPGAASPRRIRVIAAKNIAESGLGDFGSPILYQPSLKEPSEMQLAKAICDQPGSAVVVGTTQDAITDERLLESLAPLGVEAQMPMSMPDYQFEVISALDDDDEAETVASAIAGLIASGVSMRQIGVLVCGGQHQAVERHLQAMQIHPLVDWSHDLSQSPWWNLVQIAHRLSRSEYRAQDQEGFIDALAELSDSPEDVRREWLSLLRKNGLKFGWSWTEDKARKPEQSPEGGLPGSSEENAGDKSGPSIDPKVVAEACKALQIPQEATYKQYVAALRKGLDYVKGAIGASGPGADALDRMVKILDALAGVGLKSGESDLKTTAERFLYEAGTALRTASRTDPFRNRVYVGSLAQGAPIGFQHLFIMGAIDSVLPSGHPQDLSTKRMLGMEATDHVQQDRADLYTAIAGAERATIGWHATRSDSNQDNAPSRFLIELISYRLGREIMPHDLERGLQEDWHIRHSSYAAKVRKAALGSPSAKVAALATSGNADRREAANHARPQIQQTRDFLDSQRSRQAGSVDGALAAAALQKRMFTPSGIDRYLRSPRDYFYSALLRLPTRYDRTDPFHLNALVRGRLQEDVFVAWLAQQTDPEQELAKRLDQCAARGLLLADPGVQLSQKLLGESSQAICAAWEANFQNWSVLEQQHRVQIGGLFEGSLPYFSSGLVDAVVRVEQALADGEPLSSLVLVEIKSGKTFTAKGAVQLPVYLAACRRYVGQAEEGEVHGGCYALIRPDAKLETVKLDPAIDERSADLFDEGERTEHLINLIGKLAGLAARGCFVAPQDERENTKKEYLDDLGRIYAVERPTRNQGLSQEFEELKEAVMESVGAWLPGGSR